MSSGLNLAKFKRLFAGSFTRDTKVMAVIMNPSAALPSEQLSLEVAAVANWLLAVIKNHETLTDDYDGREKNAVIETEKIMLGELPQRFRQLHRDPQRTLYIRVVEAVTNARILPDDKSILQINSFLTAQTKRRVAAPPTQRSMRHAS